jgi:hypothetical protein
MLQQQLLMLAVQVLLDIAAVWLAPMPVAEPIWQCRQAEQQQQQQLLQQSDAVARAAAANAAGGPTVRLSAGVFDGAQQTQDHWLPVHALQCVQPTALHAS